MTSFGDVNVGDKVRLTAIGEYPEMHELVVADIQGSGDNKIIVSHWTRTYYSDNWSVEVLEPAPRPLPTTPGYYVTIKVHEIASDGLPDMEALVGRVAFIWNGAIVVGVAVVVLERGVHVGAVRGSVRRRGLGRDALGRVPRPRLGPHEGAGRMTEFGAVNVGDKVRATSKVIDGLSVTGTANSADAQTIEIHGYSWLHPAGWDVEVLEPAPKPLPDEPGWYISTTDGPFYLGPSGSWYCDSVTVDPDGVPRDLQRLVLESAVEEARTETLASIVEWLNLNSYGYAGKRVQERFGGQA